MTACSTRATTRPGGCWHTRVCDVPAAKVQAYVLGRAAQRRGLRLRLRYEYLQPEIDEDPEPWEPDDDDLIAVEEELRRAVERMWNYDDWPGVNDADVCRTCQYRSICRDSAAPGEPSWPVLADDGILTTRVRDPWIPAPRSSSVSARSSQREPADTAKPPIELLEDAARAAEADAGAALLARTDIVAVVQIVSWRYPDPGALLARRLGITPRRTAVTTVGGNSPQLLVNEFAERIQRGDCDVVLIGGAESMHTRWRARREPRVELDWETGDDEPCSWVIGDDRPGTSDEEMRHGAVAPTQVYPLFETALRAEAGRSIDAHQHHVAELWSTFAAVAAGNPYAWSRTAYSPTEIRTVSADNRMVVFPYPKRMCANIDVDQGAAILLCSYETARRCGRPRRSHRVPARGCRGARPLVRHRTRLADRFARARRDGCRRARCVQPSVSTTSRTSTSIRASRRRCRSRSREIGLTDTAARPLTVTGGLGFAGGPVNNYPTHAIARMVEVLRADPGSYGLTTALGWYVTKHAAGIWSTPTTGRRLPARRSARDAGAGRRASAPDRGRTGRRRRRRRSDLGRVRARRHARERHRDRPPR